MYHKVGRSGSEWAGVGRSVSEWVGVCRSGSEWVRVGRSGSEQVSTTPIIKLGRKISIPKVIIKDINPLFKPEKGEKFFGYLATFLNGLEIKKAEACYGPARNFHVQ